MERKFSEFSKFEPSTVMINILVTEFSEFNVNIQGKLNCLSRLKVYNVYGKIASD